MTFSVTTRRCIAYSDNLNVVIYISMTRRKPMTKVICRIFQQFFMFVLIDLKLLNIRRKCHRYEWELEWLFGLWACLIFGHSSANVALLKRTRKRWYASYCVYFFDHTYTSRPITGNGIHDHIVKLSCFRCRISSFQTKCPCGFILILFAIICTRTVSLRY